MQTTLHSTAKNAKRDKIQHHTAQRGERRCQQQNICFCFPLGGRCCAPCPMVSLMLNLFLLPSLTWESPHSEQLLGGMSPLGHWGRMSATFYFSMNVFFFKLPKYSNEIWMPIPRAFLLQSRPQPGALTLRYDGPSLGCHRVMAIFTRNDEKNLWILGENPIDKAQLWNKIWTIATKAAKNWSWRFFWGRSGVALLILAALCVAPVGGSGIEGSVDVGLLGFGFTWPHRYVFCTDVHSTWPYFRDIICKYVSSRHHAHSIWIVDTNGSSDTPQYLPLQCTAWVHGIYHKLWHVT